jgi:hypothetical protein
VRVGRAPIDEEAIRLLEQHNPDVQFDWTRILKSPSADAGHGYGRRAGVTRDAGRREDRRDRATDHTEHATDHAEPTERATDRTEPTERATDRTEPTERATDRTEPTEWTMDRAEPTEQTMDRAEPTERTMDRAERMEHATDHTERGREHAEPTEPATYRTERMEPATDHAERMELREPQTPPESSQAEPVESRYARIGSDGLGRLRARYAEVMARIAERPMDEAVREELKLKAERLNPDAWVTADEVSQALEEYEVVFEDLRAVVGRHPRRRSRR